MTSVLEPLVFSTNVLKHSNDDNLSETLSIFFEFLLLMMNVVRSTKILRSAVTESRCSLAPWGISDQ